MKQEDKQLLLKDLCARQMYNVKCQVFNDANPYTLSGVLHNKPHSQLYFEELDWKEYDGFVNVEYCKPYLFPMSSMTEEQFNEMYNYCYNFEREASKFSNGELKITYNYELFKFDWLNRNKFDYRGLIPMGLAIDATGLEIY